jgi:hypothetical protein
MKTISSSSPQRPICKTAGVDPIGGSGVPPRRKKAPASRARGRAGVRAVEHALESENLVVQTIETSNDIGRDAFVEIVRESEVTGGVIALQIKSGPSFRRPQGWVIPGEEEDFTLWRESTVPMFGVVCDTETMQLRWVDLSSAARARETTTSWTTSQLVAGPFGKQAVLVPDDNRLDLDVKAFIASAETALSTHRGLPVASLLSEDLGAVKTALVDLFARGRSDAAALLLVAGLLGHLPRESHRLAVQVLSQVTSNPDIAWTSDTWVPEEIRSAVRRRLSWTASEVELLLEQIDL